MDFDSGAFGSDLVDLSGLDLNDLDALPGSVLGTSIRRICRELMEDLDTFRVRDVDFISAATEADTAYDGVRGAESWHPESGPGFRSEPPAGVVES